VSKRLVNDKVEAHMAIVEITMVTLAPVLLASVMMPDGRTLEERIRNAQFDLPLPAPTR
jgi:hypothetical protein